MAGWLEKRRSGIRNALVVVLAVFLVLVLITGILGIVRVFNPPKRVTPPGPMIFEQEEFTQQPQPGHDGLDKAIGLFFILTLWSIAAAAALCVAYRVTRGTPVALEQPVPAVAPPRQTAPEPPAGGMCSSCGTRNTADSVFCMNCGTRLTG